MGISLKNTNRLKPMFFCFIFLLIIQILVFFIHSIKNVVDFYPSFFDQGAYLSHSYRLVTEIKSFNSLVVKTLDFLTRPNPQGPLLPALGALSIKLTHWSPRLASLFVNMVFWILLNLFVFSGKKFKNDDSKYLILFCLNCMPYPFYMYGGLFDFRPDFSTFCLYGVSTVLFYKFLKNPSKKNLLLSLCFWALLFLNRQITFVYANMIFFTLIFIGFCDKYLRPNQARLWPLRAVINHWFLYLILCLPFLINSFIEIKNYYFVGHVTGVEGPLRAIENNIINIKSYLLYYPKTLILNHLGMGLSSLLFLLVISALVTTKLKKIKLFSSEALYNFVCFFIPMVVLTVIKNKSPIVGGIVLLPLILFVCSIFFNVWNSQIYSKYYIFLFFLMFTAWPLMAFFKTNPLYLMPGQKIAQRQETFLVRELLNKINFVSSYHNASEFRFCGLGPYPFFFDKSLVSYNFEQNNTYLTIVNPFQNYFQHTERSDFFNKLKSCDIIAYDELQKVDLYPINQDVFSIIPSLNQNLHSIFIKYKTIDIEDKRFVFWIRKDIDQN